jgi:ferritin
MLSPEMEAALNQQINEEMYSAYIYLSMANYFEATGLRGFASWMRVQSQEESAHADKFVNYVNDRGGRVLLKAIAEPPADWDSPVAAFENVAQHESYITGCINKLSTQAAKEDDHATHNFLEWFVGEQVEEEASANDALGRLKLADNAPGAMLFLDQEFGSRTFTPPA